MRVEVRPEAPLARTKAATNFESADAPIRGALLEPVGVVRRELVSPSGSVVVVDVPVYPPFRLETDQERSDRKERCERAAS